MQRCPCCHARLNDAPQCRRCGADLSAARQTEQQARLWLALSVQALRRDAPELAARAVNRALSYRKTRPARLWQAFLERQFYDALYQNIQQQRWPKARVFLTSLQRLNGTDQGALRRFQELIDSVTDTRPSAVTGDIGQTSPH
ncbi:MAG: hypothetical protein RQ715_09685 [Methylococcales bacterium]|nr:hypothetical protein [Methylococcales bacterium]